MDHSVAAPSALRASREVLGAPVGSSSDGRLLSVVRAPDNTFGELISSGGHVQGIAPPLIDPRLLNEDSSFNHRITQRQRNPRRRDSDYVRFRYGLPEKLGGWVSFNNPQKYFVGAVSEVFTWN